MAFLKPDKFEEVIEASNKKYGLIESESTGTDSYTVFNPFARMFVATSGVMSMAKENECFWALDVVASYANKIIREFQKTTNTFYVVHVLKNMEDSGATFYLSDGDYNILITQKIPFSDIPKNLYMFLQFDGGQHFVLMMPSEY